MNQEDVKAVIDQLLKTGEILASKAFELAVRQVYVYAIMDVIAGILFLVLGIIFARKGWKEGFDSGDANDWSLGLGTLAIGLGIALNLMSIRFFLNPEWYAIDTLIKLFTVRN